MGVAIANNRDPAVEWDVEPFVTVRRPAVGQFDAIQMVAVLAARLREQAKRAVYMDPCASFMSNWNKLGERIARADVQIGGVQHHDRGT